VRVLLYVDDMLIAASDLSVVFSMKAKVLAKFPGKDPGPCTYFLQVVVQRDRQARVVILRKERRIDDLVTRVGVFEAHEHTVPMIDGVFRDSTGDRGVRLRPLLQAYLAESSPACQRKRIGRQQILPCKSAALDSDSQHPSDTLHGTSRTGRQGC
jgi:hypothetical protein